MSYAPCREQSTFAVYACSFPQSTWILVSILTTFLKITFPRSSVKSQLQHLKVSSPWQTSAVSDMVISPLWATPLLASWHLLSWFTRKLSHCSFSVSVTPSSPTTFLSGLALGPLLLQYMVFGHPHLCSGFPPPALDWLFPSTAPDFRLPEWRAGYIWMDIPHWRPPWPHGSADSRRNLPSSPFLWGARSCWGQGDWEHWCPWTSIYSFLEEGKGGLLAWEEIWGSTNTRQLPHSWSIRGSCPLSRGLPVPSGSALSPHPGCLWASPSRWPQGHRKCKMCKTDLIILSSSIILPHIYIRCHHLVSRIET